MDLITETNLNNSWLETMTVQEFYYHVKGFNSIQTDVNNWRKQRLSYSRLSNGIQVKILDYINYQDYGKIIEHEEDKPLISHFLLSGDHHVSCPGVINNQAEYTEKSGQNYLAFLPSIEEIEKAYQEENNQIIIINLPVNFVREFISELKEIPQELKPLMEGDRAPRFHRPVGNITPMMRTVIKQILEHPYQGIIARMYLEAKVLELISLQLFQLIQQENQQPRCLNLSTQEIEQVYEAQAILKTNYLQPPSIVELAQKVGLDRMKLQQGFRELFQVTPFQYLQNYRLDLARILLEEKDLTVSNVAHRIGYSNVSYFSRAFKRRFGVTPGKYRS
ncbi:UNVERIFIED_CONTAM: AraC family transcriptional regulator [Euhalothece sp. KZN 001]